MWWWWVPWGRFYNVGSCLLVWRVLWSTYYNIDWIREGQNGTPSIALVNNFLWLQFYFYGIYNNKKNYFKFNLSHTLGLEITKSSPWNLLLIEGIPIITRACPNFLKRNFLYLIDSFMTKYLNIQYLCTVGT